MTSIVGRNYLEGSTEAALKFRVMLSFITTRGVPSIDENGVYWQAHFNVAGS